MKTNEHKIKYVDCIIMACQDLKMEWDSRAKRRELEGMETSTFARYHDAEMKLNENLHSLAQAVLFLKILSHTRYRMRAFSTEMRTLRRREGEK